MSYKIAVASSDGMVINRHFGRAEQFLIFEVEGDNYKFLELRSNTPSCVQWEHSEEAMLNSLKLLSDCSIVIASRIGRGASEFLNCNGIKTYSAVGFIEDILKSIIEI